MIPRRLTKKLSTVPSDKGEREKDRIGNLVEGTRQEEGRQLTKNLGVSVERTQGIGSGLCPVLRCEEGNG